MSGRGSEVVRLPADAWRDPHMVRAWRTRDFRAVFLLASRLGMSPEIIAGNTRLPMDMVLNVMKGNTTLSADSGVAESVAAGLGMPANVRGVLGLSPRAERPPVRAPGPREISEIKASRPAGHQQARAAPLARGRPGKRRERLPDYLPAHIVHRPDFIAARDKRDLGAMFGILIDAGFTVSHLARRCEMGVSQIGDYVYRGRTAQNVDIFCRVSDGLHIPGAMLGVGRRPWEEEAADAEGTASEYAAASEAQSGRLTIAPDTREGAGASSGPLVMPAHGGEVPPSGQIELLRQELNDVLGEGAMAEGSLDDWERTAIRYARATRDRPANVVLSDVTRDLVELKLALARHRSASAMRRLTRVTAQMSGLMCLILCLLDDRPAFRRWARTARLAGNEAGDPETLSWVLAQEAYGHYYSEDMLEAIDVARHAYEVARTPCAGAALAAALEGRAHAAIGRREETREALARAESMLSQLHGDALIPSAFGYNEAAFRFHEGNAYTHLRDMEPAFKAQARALELCSQDNYTDWAMTRLDHAQCLVYSGDVNGGLAYAAETMTSLTGAQRRGIITLRGRELVEALPERDKLITARDFKDLLLLIDGKREITP